MYETKKTNDGNQRTNEPLGEANAKKMAILHTWENRHLFGW